MTGYEPYQPRGAAEQLFYCREPEVLLSGPAGTGKSRACLEKLHLCALKYPGTRALVVRKTRASLTESALVTFEDKVLPPGSCVAKGPTRAHRFFYRYPTGSEVVVAGLDRPSRVMSTEYDLVFVQEAVELTEGEWEALSSRLRNGRVPYQQLLADTNPAGPGHWLKKREAAGRLRLIESRHEDNPAVTPEYLARLDQLTGVRYHRLRHGRWVQAEGVVYDGWDPALHLVDRFPIPDSWRRFRCVDFGYTNPFVCQWWALDLDGRLYLYRELYLTQRLVTEHAATIQELSAGERIEATLADHDAEDRATLHACGIPTLAAYKSIGRGIQAVTQRLAPAGDGRPRLLVLRDSLVQADAERLAGGKPVCLSQEIDSYVWPQSAEGRPVREVPAPGEDHSMDAMRYMVAHLDCLPPAAPWRLYG